MHLEEPTGDTISVIGKTTLITALLYGFFCAVCFIVFRWQLPLIFNENPAVVHLSAILLLYAAVFQISDATQATGAGLLRGIKDVKVPTLLITIAYWVIGLPVGWIFAFHYRMGAPGMWLGLIMGLTLASIFLGIRFLQMAKKNNLTAPILNQTLIESNPLFRSSIRSSIYSTPMERRSRLAGLFGEITLCRTAVFNQTFHATQAGSMFKQFHTAGKPEACFSPPFMPMEIMDPNCPFICRFAISWFG